MASLLTGEGEGMGGGGSRGGGEGICQDLYGKLTFAYLNPHKYNKSTCDQ